MKAKASTTNCKRGTKYILNWYSLWARDQELYENGKLRRLRYKNTTYHALFLILN